MSKRIKYRSRYEAKVARDLRAKKVRFKFELHTYTYQFPLVGGICSDCSSTDVYKWRSYTPDFFFAGGIIIETKGKMDRSERKKLVAIKKEYPDMDLRLLFMRNNPLYRGSKTRYIGWAEKHGFLCAVGLVPENWIKEIKGG